MGRVDGDVVEVRAPANGSAFLIGGGETGRLISAFDWSQTSIGPIESWPQSLKTTVSILLHSPVPIVLLWGEDGVMLYNDAYSVFAAARHPALLGSKVREGWPEVADFNDNVMRVGLAGGTLAYKDQELTLYRRGAPEQVWMNLDYSPVYGETGRPEGVIAVVVETTDRVLSERRMAAERERLAQMFEQAPVIITLMEGPDHRYVLSNAAHRRLLGREDVVGRTLREVQAPIVSEPLVALLDQVYATGETFSGKSLPVPTADGDGPPRIRLMDVILQPIADREHNVTGIFILATDVTERARGEAALRESEGRLSVALAVARLGAFDWNTASGVVTLDERAREIFGLPPGDEVDAEEVFARIEPEWLPKVRAAAATSIEARKRMEIEYPIRLPDGTRKTVVSLSDVVEGESGPRAVGVFDDVTEQRRAEEQQRLLINELNHRVKNTLATVQSIAAQTRRSTGDPQAAYHAFVERLVALSRSHDVLTREHWRGADLREIVTESLRPFAGPGADRFEVAGPSVRLNPQSALAIGMALHELATNAVKYGALSVPAGRVSVAWRIGADGELMLTWRESGGPPVTPPTRQGFGSRLLKQGLARELSGAVTLEYLPEGVSCTIRARLTDELRPQLR
ncbi:PAS domain-containing sensor histidine kinase [Phenylobacterium soli]|uniref:histidine kinase n=1 Tax=Phenylobacterium soli TaxID=2170551 RepID=A0A328AIV7_9CAUL|nr:HWE histidine kinase domain-containing protein [Phenylobacterium soli]RAK54873.1 hypothetical protein DJ017_10220 [Phenylobacterium soli]